MIKNYHEQSMKYEDEYAEELLVLFGALLLMLNDIEHLTDSAIENTILQWKMLYSQEIDRLNYEYVKKLQRFSNTIIAPMQKEQAKKSKDSPNTNPSAKTSVKDVQLPTQNIDNIFVNQNNEIIAQNMKADQLAVANTKMLDATTSYIETKFKELAVLENTYHYSSAQATDFIQQISQTTEDKLSLFATMSTINNLREFIMSNAKEDGYTEYLWRTQRDSRVRPSHAAMDNRWFKIDDPAPQPCGFQPGVDYNCRCYMIDFR